MTSSWDDQGLPLWLAIRKMEYHSKHLQIRITKPRGRRMKKVGSRREEKIPLFSSNLRYRPSRLHFLSDTMFYIPVVDFLLFPIPLFSLIYNNVSWSVILKRHKESPGLSKHKRCRMKLEWKQNNVNNNFSCLYISIHKSCYVYRNWNKFVGCLIKLIDGWQTKDWFFYWVVVIIYIIKPEPTELNTNMGADLLTFGTSQSSLSGHSRTVRTTLLTAALTKLHLNSSSYKLCIDTFP